MENCPTCGQPILPSMGIQTAHKAKKAAQDLHTPHQKRINPIRRIQPQRPQSAQVNTRNPSEAPQEALTQTLRIRNSLFSLRTETTNRGYVASLPPGIVHKEGSNSSECSRYRFRTALMVFPRRGTIAGTLTVLCIPTKEEKENGTTVIRKNYNLDEKTLSTPLAPLTWTVETDEVGPIELALSPKS